MARLIHRSHDDLSLSSREESRRERRGFLIWLSFVMSSVALTVVGCIYRITWAIYAGIVLISLIAFLLICVACMIRYLNTYDDHRHLDTKDPQ